MKDYMKITLDCWRAPITTIKPVVKCLTILFNVIVYSFKISKQI